jgi:hypothetical protein
MPTTTPTRRQPITTRRFGYAIAVLFNAAVIWLVNVWPGWESLSFLTEETPQVLVLVNVSLVVSAVVNVVYFGYDPPWVVALGAMLTTGLGLAALIRIWQVFPFDFGGTFDWAAVARVLLVVGMAGSVIGLLVQFGQLIRAVGRSTER